MSKTFQTGLLPQKFLKAMRPEDRNPMGKAGVTTPEAKAKFDARTEKEVHKQICQWLDLHEIYYVHHRMDGKAGLRRERRIFTCKGLILCARFA